MSCIPHNFRALVHAQDSGSVLKRLKKKKKEIYPEAESEKTDGKGGQCKENNKQTNVARSKVFSKTQTFYAWGKNVMLSMYKSS